MTDESCATVFGYCSGEATNVHQEESEDIQVVLADREECRRILKEEHVAIMCALYADAFHCVGWGSSGIPGCVISHCYQRRSLFMSHTIAAVSTGSQVSASAFSGCPAMTASKLLTGFSLCKAENPFRLFRSGS